MAFREATLQDIPQIQIVRHAVKENVLSDPGLVTDKDCANYLINRGKGWVCELNGQIVGFSIADLSDNNIWALFVDPQFEHRVSEENYMNSCWTGIFPRAKRMFGYAPLRIQGPFHFIKKRLAGDGYPR